MIQMEAGALLAGKIRNRISVLNSGYIQRGEEKGYFEFGGSTIILLLQKNTVWINEELYKRQDSSREIPVHMGEFVARTEKEGGLPV